MSKGIDVSVYQGNINWQAVKDCGVEFALLRVGYGWSNDNQKDKTFEQNYKCAKEVGMPIGIYHYSYATTPDEAILEAETVLRWIESKQFEYPIYFDVENQKTANTGKENCTNIVKAFCSRLEKEGYFVGVYANTNWFRNYLDYAELSKLYTIWKADYRDNFDTSIACDIHQYCSDGNVNGISAKVDMNNCTRDFSIIKNGGYNGFSKPINAPVAPPVFNHLHNVGEWVRYSTCYNSATDTIDKHLNQSGTAQIIGIVDFTQNYCKLSNSLYVNNGDIREVLTSAPQVVPIAQAIKVGDKVSVIKAIQYNGQSFNTWGRTSFDVMNINGDKATIGDKGVITCNVKINNIKKI